MSYTAHLGAAPLPTWLSFNNISRTFTARLAACAPGSYTLNLTATDGVGGAASVPFNMAVFAAPSLPSTELKSLLQSLLPVLAGVCLLCAVVVGLVWQVRLKRRMGAHVAALLSDASSPRPQ